MWGLISEVQTSVRRDEQGSVIHQNRGASLTLEWNDQRIEGSADNSTDRLRLMLLRSIESFSLSCPEWLPSANRLRAEVN